MANLTQPNQLDELGGALVSSPQAFVIAPVRPGFADS
jgi:hypothetical protein